MKKMFLTTLLLMFAGIALMGYVIYLQFVLMKSFGELESELDNSNNFSPSNGLSHDKTEDAKVSAGSEIPGSQT